MSAVVGYIGIVLLLWMYVLDAKSVMSMVFHDLAPVVRIHKALGKWGSLAVVLHPLLIIYSYGESLLYPLIPHIGTEFERHVTLGRIAFWLMVITAILSVYFRKRIGFRTWKYIHYLAYICVPFALLHIPNVGSQYMQHQLVKLYFFGLVMTFVIFTVLRIRGLFNLDKIAYTIISNQKITDDDYLLHLKPRGTYLKPRRGQYVYLKLGFISEDHPFSVTQYNETTGELLLTYRKFGMFTKVASELQAQHTVYIGGPFGEFTREIDKLTTPVVYIAGGIGITPFIDRIIRESKNREQWLFAANREPHSAVFVSTLKPFLPAHCVEIYESVPPNYQGIVETGYMNKAIIKKYLARPESYHYFVCGPPPMMAAVTKMLADMGIDQRRIHTETFGW